MIDVPECCNNESDVLHLIHGCRNIIREGVVIMRKALRIVSISAGIVSVVSAVILGYIYLEDIAGYINKTKTKLINKIEDE